VPAPFTINQIWAGQTAVIIGGGPSLCTEQVRRVAIARLENRCRVICVNDSVYLAWWGDWLHAHDAQWWCWHAQRVQHFRGIKTTVSEQVPAAWITGALRWTGRTGFDTDPSCCRGDTSGAQAIHIAVQAGAKKILLLGFDATQDHWFGSHQDGINNDLSSSARDFETLLPTLRERSVDVINCSPDSKIECFEKAPLSGLL